MTHRAYKSPAHYLGRGKYLGRLSRAWPGARTWVGGRGSREFWPEGAKLVIAISLEFEAGAPPDPRTGSPFPAVDEKHPDLAVSKWHEYGFKEGVPRLLEIFERRRVQVTAHMLGAAVDRNPELAREIVERGHEAAAHGQDGTPQCFLTPKQEGLSLEANVESILRATGTRPIGFHALGLRGTCHTVKVLQELGFLYYLDDISRDEPFLIMARSEPFVVVPHALTLNDLIAYERRGFSSEQYADELRNEFEMLYSEAETRRRMMSISAHDRIAGRPARAKVLEEFIIYAQRRPGVVFLRQDEIARFALASPLTPREQELPKAEGLEAA